MQFFILLLGVMVFIFYQFETAPLNFNPKSLQAVQNSPYAESFRLLENKNQTLQEKKQAVLTHPDFFSDTNLQKEFKLLNTQEKVQREEAKEIISKADSNIETNDKDYVFISYVLNYLPHGLIGLLLAVIFSAAMSSTASELNALAATTTIDLYRRNLEGKSEKHYVNASKGFTLMWGVFAIAFASIGNLFENLIQLVNIIGSLFYGTILGVFLAALFIKNIKGKAIFYAAILSEALIIAIFFQEVVSYLWLNLIGVVLTIIIAQIIQMFDKKNTNKTI